MCGCDEGAVVVVEDVCGCDGGTVVVVEGECVAVMVGGGCGGGSVCSCDGGAVVVVESVCGCDGGAVVVVEGECVAVIVVRWLWRFQKGETWKGSKCYWLERWRWEKTKGRLVTDEVLQGKLPP